MRQRVALAGMLRDELQNFFEELGEPGYRGDQVFEWIHGQLVEDFDGMTNLPLTLRRRLAKLAVIDGTTVTRRQVDLTDDTRKYLLKLGDGELVETVMMSYEHGRSVCLSTQAGCRQGCTFCASTVGGLTRNLEPVEIVAQVLAFARELKGTGESIRSIVFMGMGEPLENLDSVIKSLHILHDPRGMNVGYRHMTVSTCGLVPEIDLLAAEELPITLAVSLHGPNDEVRSRLMPVNRRYPVRELLAACHRYVARTGRRISFEYILIDGINDSPELARELVRLVEGLLCHVNLIPLTPVAERPWKRPPQQAVDAFRRVLERAGIPTTIRRTLGTDIDAACGQLRRREISRRRW